MYKDKLWELVEDEGLGEEIAKNLIKWISEDTCKEFFEFYYNEEEE